MHRITVTHENLENVREACAALDQATELVPGCETWGILYVGGQRGQMTRWPDGRGAVCWGGDSHWGEWTTEGIEGEADVLKLDETDDSGAPILVDEDGDSFCEAWVD